MRYAVVVLIVPTIIAMFFWSLIGFIIVDWDVVGWGTGLRLTFVLLWGVVTAILLPVALVALYEYTKEQLKKLSLEKALDGNHHHKP